MFDVVLYEPEIPPNTGNVIRLCANTGARLHLVRPLGFSLHDSQLRRAGLDYHAFVQALLHPDWPSCLDHFQGRRIFPVTTRGTQRHDQPQYSAQDVFLFGPETRGLPVAVIDAFPVSQRIRLPMINGSRSLNLSNAVAIVVFEAWRQLDFRGGA